jgi:allophanate hydrolase subunit 2
MPFEVTPAADRMGIRLRGPELKLRGAELLSLGLAPGTLQVPPSGEPILQMADHQTAGGYPVVAGVPRADLPLAAQLVPGDRVEFRTETVEAAQARWRAIRAALDSALPPR